MFVPATDDDVPRIVALMNRAYRGAGASAGWSTEEAYIAGDRTTEALLRAELLAKPGAALLKWEDAKTDSLLGCVWMEPLVDRIWYLGSLTTEPARQNDGLGRTLLAAAECWAYEQGGTRIRITVVNVRETLIAWYLRRGYHLTGRTEPFPKGMTGLARRCATILPFWCSRRVCSAKIREHEPAHGWNDGRFHPHTHVDTAPE